MIKGISPRGLVMNAVPSPNSAVLTCWKDIAHYLGKSVRTVQRWERHFGLPVRRPDGVNHKSAVVAYPRDLDRWLHSRWSRRSIQQRCLQDQNAIKFSIISGEISDGVRIAGELRSELRSLRTEHRTLMKELALALTSLRHTCREYPWQSNALSSSFQKPPTKAA